MLEFLNYCLLVTATLTALPIVVVFMECSAALLPRRPRRADVRPRIDVLIPAHNEAAVIRETLHSVRRQLLAGDRLIVVADNCTDGTAEIARVCGAQVYERHDPIRRGKGFALDFGVQSLEAEHGEVVIVIDADCSLADGTLDTLARECAATGKPVQAAYVMTCPPQPSPRDLVSRFAVTVKNQVRQRGATALGGSGLLTGSGMAFPWSILRSVELAGGNIVEDMQLSFDLLVAGHAPRFCAEAEVVAPLPQARNASLSQRTRWEHGHLQTLLRTVPRLIWQGLKQRRPLLWAAALDLAVPPLSLLCLLWSAVFSATAFAAWCGGSELPLLIAAGSGMLLLAAMLVVVCAFARDVSPLALFLAVPRYIVAKLPIYMSFLFRRQTAWVRTDRAAMPLHAGRHRAAEARESRGV